MGTKGTTSYRIHDQNALYFITIATVFWIDLFSRRRNKDILIESLQYCKQNKGAAVIGLLHYDKPYSLYLPGQRRFPAFRYFA